MIAVTFKRVGIVTTIVKTNHRSNQLNLKVYTSGIKVDKVFNTGISNKIIQIPLNLKMEHLIMVKIGNKLKTIMTIRLVRIIIMANPLKMLRIILNRIHKMLQNPKEL